MSDLPLAVPSILTRFMQYRSADIFSGRNVLFVGGQHDSWVQLPIIPNQV